jgi:hypothetical protein
MGRKKAQNTQKQPNYITLFFAIFVPSCGQRFPFVSSRLSGSLPIAQPPDGFIAIAIHKFQALNNECIMTMAR